jgi:AcrR family transcriptional regulator
VEAVVDRHSPWKALRYRKFEAATKREAVLREAARTFNEKGFHSTSVDEIAERLHVTKPTLYYYFRSKEEILYECLLRGLSELEDVADAALIAAGTGRERLIAVMHAYSGIVLGDFGYTTVHVGQDPLNAQRRTQARRVERRVAHKLQKLIAAGIEDGSIARCDPKIMASTFAGALNWMTRWYRPGGPLNADEITQRCIELLLTGFVPRDESGKAVVREPRSRSRRA